MNQDSTEALAEFTPMERAALRCKMETVPIKDFHTVTEWEWRLYRGCGSRFIKKLQARGWIFEIPQGLTNRDAWKLQCVDIAINKDAVLSAIKSGRLLTARGIGNTTRKRIFNWVGQEMPGKSKSWLFNPWTGKPMK